MVIESDILVVWRMVGIDDDKDDVIGYVLERMLLEQVCFAIW